MSDTTLPDPNSAQHTPLAARLGDLARKAGDLAVVAFAWGASWGLVGLALYGAVRVL